MHTDTHLFFYLTHFCCVLFICVIYFSRVYFSVVYLGIQYFPVQFNKGEHGFDNEDMDMKAFFRAAGPAFRKGLKVGPFETVHIYPLMCHILGIRPEVNDGRLDVTSEMLLTRTAQDDGQRLALSTLHGVTALQ